MSSDLARTLAFAFRRKGESALPGPELRLLLAYDLRWFAPEDAKRVVTRAVETGLLHQDEDGTLRPAFDLDAVQVPVNFRPGREVLDETLDAPLPPPTAAPSAPRPASVAPAPVEPAPAEPAPAEPAPAGSDAAARPAPDADRLVKQELERRLGLVSESVARLVLARRNGEDVLERARQLESDLLNS